MAISLQRLTIYLYSAHRAVIFAIAQLSCNVRSWSWSYTHFSDQERTVYIDSLTQARYTSESPIDNRIDLRFSACAKQERPAVADKSARRKSMPKIVPIWRAYRYNVVQCWNWPKSRALSNRLFQGGVWNCQGGPSSGRRPRVEAQSAERGSGL